LNPGYFLSLVMESKTIEVCWSKPGFDTKLNRNHEDTQVLVLFCPLCGSACCNVLRFHWFNDGGKSIEEGDGLNWHAGKVNVLTLLIRRAAGHDRHTVSHRLH